MKEQRATIEEVQTLISQHMRSIRCSSKQPSPAAVKAATAMATMSGGYIRAAAFAVKGAGVMCIKPDLAYLELGGKNPQPAK